MNIANIEKFKRMNLVLIKRGKYPKEWTPYIAEYYLNYEPQNMKQK